jgi:putative spermidine/putrescine transport system permease protein
LKGTGEPFRVATLPETNALAPSDRTRTLRRTLLLAGVPFLFLVLFFVNPLLRIGRLSFGEESFSLSYYEDFFRSELYTGTLLRTLLSAAAVTSVCLLIGYPYAYVMANTRRRTRVVMLVFLLLPFWTSVLVRTYAWQILLQDTGLINRLLLSIGVIEDPLPLIRNTQGVLIGMTHVLLPFMVLALFAVMSRIDRKIMSAAISLGATPLAAFRTTYLPLSLPGIVAGSTLVFVLTIGFYITPAILGDPRSSFLSQLIVQQAQHLLNWELASAMSVVLFVATFLFVALGQWLNQSRSRATGDSWVGVR